MSSGRRRGFKDINGHSLQVDAIAGIPRLKVIVKVVSRGHDPGGEPVIVYDVLDRLGVRAPRRRALVSEADPRDMVLLRTTLDRIRFMNGNGRKTDFGRNDMMFRELYGGPPPGGGPGGAPAGTLLTEAGLQRILPNALQAAQNINIADLGKLKGIFTQFPHLAKAVEDKILTNQTILRMTEEQLVKAERDLVDSTAKTERRMQEAYSRTNEEAEGRAAGKDVSVRYAHVDAVQKSAPFVSSIPPQIKLYQAPSFAR